MYMSRRRKKGSKSKQKSSKPSNNADLQTPLHLAALETPTSISSLTCSPSDLTPTIAALENISILSPGDYLPPPTATMDPFDETVNYAHLAPSSPESPLPDLHRAKLQGGTPRYSRTDTLKSFSRAFSASKRLQQMMGLQDPVPFVTPPLMPKGLEQAFLDNLQEFGLDYEGIWMGNGVTHELMTGAGGMHSKLEKSKLPDIIEEAESPTKTTFSTVENVGSAPGNGLSIAPPVWPTGSQAQPGSKEQRLTALSTSQPSNSYEGDSDSGTDDGGDTSYHYGSLNQGGLSSSTTLAESQSSRPGNPAVASHPLPPSNSGKVLTSINDSTFARASDYGGEYGLIGAGFRPPPRSSSLFDLTNHTLGTTATEIPELGRNQDLQVGCAGYIGALQQSGSTSNVLFPSPRVEEPPWGFVKTNVGFDPRGFVPSGHTANVPSATQSGAPAGLFNHDRMRNIPQIRIQSPSPKKIPTSRKRASSLSSQELFGPPVTRARSEDSIGLPILPAESEMLWKFKFPGNTHALLTILINWSCTMGSMYNRYPDPKGFPHNAAFPWPIRPPVYQQLISVGFYDTSVTPHKEIRFLGPGDATEIAYAEVDTFRSQEDIEAFQEQQNQDRRTEAMRRLLGLDSSYQKGSRYMSSHQRAVTGEGRWAYILIKGNQTAKDETPPHLIIAFHHSAVTDESTCLHTILPDDHVTHSTSSQTPPSLPLKRFNSLQNLINASRNPLRLHQALRSASSSELPRADVASIDLQDGAQTLQRTVLKMEKAGGIPLIEGYRVDIGAFRSWLDAVGRGSGKLMMWKEKE